jgi:hypothetical protein
VRGGGRRRAKKGFLGRFGRVAASASVVAAMALTGTAGTAGASVHSAPAAPKVQHQSDPAVRASSFSHIAVAAAPSHDAHGFWVAFADGSVVADGDAVWHGDLAGKALNAPIVGIAPTADGKGYWLLGGDGGVFSFGDAYFMGSTGNEHLNAPALQMQTTLDGRGYFFVAGDGGMFTFGNAVYYGSTGSEHLNRPVVGMASTPDGKGYWLVASDGGIFTFGDAGFHGSTGSEHLNQPVVAMARTSNGGGYWMLAADGGMFTFGNAGFHGSGVGLVGSGRAVGLVATSDGGGYWIVTSAGRVLNFGDATAMANAAVAPQGPSGPPAYSPQYAYEVTNGAGVAARWNPCDVIHYSVVWPGAPAGWQLDVTTAIAQLSLGTGLSFAYDGAYSSTAAVPGSTKLTISWVPSLSGGDMVGLTTYYYINSPGWPPEYVSANVQMLSGMPGGFLGANAEGPVLLHELGHAVGLAHTPGAPEVMNPIDQGYPLYQLGDLNGLWHLGASGGCSGFYS